MRDRGGGWVPCRRIARRDAALGDRSLLCIHYLFIDHFVIGQHRFLSKLGYFENKWSTSNSCPRMKGVCKSGCMIIQHTQHLLWALQLLTHLVLLTIIIKVVAVTPIFQIRKLKHRKKKVSYTTTYFVLGAKLAGLFHINLSNPGNRYRIFGELQL